MTGLLIAVAVSTACSTTIRATARPPDTPRVSGEFEHDLFDAVLSKRVDAKGRVDYSALAYDSSELDAYYSLLGRYSPDRTPELFPTESSRLAYWINAYNAAAIKTVLHHYPIDSVLDVEKPLFAFFLPAPAGFFVFQKMRLGGDEMSLYELENDVVRKRFDEPRVHFALNCASLGCPHLPREAFTAGRLDEELDREARKFLGQSRNLRIDREAETIYLSEIFDWYEEDFVTCHHENYPGRETGLLGYVTLYVDDEMAASLEDAIASGYDVKFMPYDWTLNDQEPPKATKH